jgi:hypothetical protein
MGNYYAMELTVALALKVPVLGEVRTLSRSLLLAEHVEAEGGLFHEQHLCAVEVEDNIRFSETEITEQFVQNIVHKRAPLVIREEEGRETFAWNPSLVEVGYQVGGGALPQSIEDPRVFDWDKDTHPAATLLLHIPMLGAVEVYVVQRNDLRLSGAARHKKSELKEGELSEIWGEVQIDVLEQKVLDSSHVLFRNSASATAFSSDSFFRMLPITKGSCSEVLSTLYPLEPQPWLTGEAD